MIAFVDSSFFYSYLDADDAHHAAVLQAWAAAVVRRRDTPLTSNYVIAETLALAQSRLGLGSVRHFVTDIVPALSIHWVNQSLHDRAVSALLAAGRRGLSLADCASFEIMRQRGIQTAFAIDRHFTEQGFECVP